MATLAELYEFLETKQDDSHLDSRFSYDAFLPVEQPKARLEILTWWKIERLIEDENCNLLYLILMNVLKLRITSY